MGDVLATICAREDLDASSARVVHGGQINRVYVVEERYVVRVGSGPEANRRLCTEADLLATLAGRVPVPTVHAIGSCGEVTYQIQGLIEGWPLHHVWLSLTQEEKGRLIAELVGYLRTLHGISRAGFGPAADPLGRTSSWATYCEEVLNHSRADLVARGVGVPDALWDRVAEHWDEHRTSLEGGRACLVHGDVWPGNVLVRDGHVVGLLDLELAMHAPADYELLLIEQFCLYPNDFAEGDREVYTTGDFGDLARLLRAHYAELFDVPRLRERLDLYHLLYAMEAYLSWLISTGQSGAGRLAVPLVSKLSNFVHAHGARIF